MLQPGKSLNLWEGSCKSALEEIEKKQLKTWGRGGGACSLCFVCF